MVTQSQVGAALKIVQAVADTVREAGSVPAGTVYAALMAHGCTLGQFEGIVGILEGAGLVTNRGNVLHWNGPHSDRFVPMPVGV